MPDVGGIAGAHLRSFIERIERLQEERVTLSRDIAEVYKEAKGTGFDTKTMREIVRLRRMDKDDLDEQDTLLDLYKRALGMLGADDIGTAEAEAEPPITPAGSGVGRYDGPPQSWSGILTRSDLPEVRAGSEH